MEFAVSPHIGSHDIFLIHSLCRRLALLLASTLHNDIPFVT
jgi:hypothetical protein